jgi:hypothetical protein
MATIYSIDKSADGLWKTIDIKTKKVTGSYQTKVAAVNEAQQLASQGVTVIVHGVDGSIQQVLGVKETIKKAPVKRRMTNKEVNKAIASVLNS